MITLSETLTPLLAPVTDAQPCGTSLVAHPDYIAIKEQVAPQLSGIALPDNRTSIRWHDIYDQCLALLQQSKDLHLLMWLCRAALHTQGLTGFAQGLLLTRTLLSDYWDGLYPLLDHEDDDDPTERINALYLLNDATTLLKDLKQQPLLQVARGHTWILGDFVTAPRQLDEAAAQQSLDEILTRMESADAENVIHAASHLHTTFRDMCAFIEKKAGPGCLCNLEQFAWLTDRIRVLFASTRLGKVSQSTDIGADSNLPHNQSQSAPVPAMSTPTGIQNRADVLKTLDLLIDYYEKNEPSSPVPLLIQRTKKAVNMNFLDVIAEFIPQGLNEAKTLMGQHNR